MDRHGVPRFEDAYDAAGIRDDSLADWLEQIALEAASIVVLTHGGVRRLIAARLAARGWHPAHRKRSYANWSTWELHRNGAA